MLRTLLTTFVLSSALAIDSTLNGVAFSADIAILEGLERAYWTTIQRRLNQIKIPDITLNDDDHIWKNDLTITEPNEHFNFYNDVENNCMTVSMHQFHAKFTSDDFHAKYGILGAHGEIKMTIDDAKFQFGYRFITQTLEDGRTIPAIESCNFDFSGFTKDEMSITVSGSFWDGFVDMFKQLIEPHIVDAIVGAAQKELTVAIPQEVNALFAMTGGAIELKPMLEVHNWFVDIEEPVAAPVTETSVNWGMRGLFYNNDKNETVPTFPVMQYKDENLASELQIMLSQQSVSSFFDTLLEVHSFDGFFNASQVPETAKFKLNCGTLDKAFKGISDYYGKDTPVDVEYKILKIHDFNLSSEMPYITLYADLDLKFYAETENGSELAVDISLTDFEFQGSLLMNETLVDELSMNITNLKVKNIAVNSCSFGKIGTFKLKMELNVGLAVAAPMLAKKVSAVSLPSSVLGKLNISDYEIAYHDGYLAIGLTPIFIAPPMPPAPASATAAERVCVRNKAGFVLKWQFKNKHTKEMSDDTEHYPIDQTYCMNVIDALPGAIEGESIQTIVHATAGSTKHVDHTIVYAPGTGITTNYTCRGATLTYSCTDDALHEEDQFDEQLAMQQLLDLFIQ